MKKETIEALTELAKAAARSQGLDENQIEFVVCNTTEPNVCDIHCTGCEGQTHHWMEDAFEESETGFSTDRPIWCCKHCEHFVFFGDTQNHPSGCDCPDCCPDEHWLCNCGNFIENGLHCTTCGAQPPWGCPCNFCDGGGDDSDYPWCGEFDDDF